MVGSAPEVYRLNLEEGRFMTPLSSSSHAINACGGLLGLLWGWGWLGWVGLEGDTDLQRQQ